MAQSLAAYVSAGLGAALAVSIGVSHRQLCALISFAAGTLLSVTLFHILPEAKENGLSVASLGFALASGYGLFFLISRYVFHVCPACAASHFEHQSESKFKNIFFLLAIALTIHSIMDGMAIALSPHMSQGAADPSLFFTVAIHKIPEGLALCALLMKSSFSRTKALLGTLAFELSTLLGWTIGHGMIGLEMSVSWLNLVMVHIAGGFVYLAFHAAINEIRDHSPRFILSFFLLGLLFMALVR
ncbi:MAG: ZIP family metal transporter [Candidatus Omnitrophica bacterium]|nr:ZIP family metal transporter [Candidatus Omnitrophota bacterium]